jgi:hypothetical protein
LPADLERLDRVLADEALLAPVARRWQTAWPAAVGRDRATVPIVVYVRLMVVKQRAGWGYETLVREVADSLHLRRRCLIGLHGLVADESTLRKLTRRLGDEVVAEISGALIVKDSGRRGLPRMRSGSTRQLWRLTCATGPMRRWRTLRCGVSRGLPSQAGRAGA